MVIPPLCNNVGFLRRPAPARSPDAQRGASDVIGLSFQRERALEGAGRAVRQHEVEGRGAASGHTLELAGAVIDGPGGAGGGPDPGQPVRVAVLVEVVAIAAAVLDA